MRAGPASDPTNIQSYFSFGPELSISFLKDTVIPGAVVDDLDQPIPGSKFHSVIIENPRTGARVFGGLATNDPAVSGRALDTSDRIKMELDNVFPGLSDGDIFEVTSTLLIANSQIHDRIKEHMADFNGNGELEVNDIDALTEQVRAGSTNTMFDLNSDGMINSFDRIVWVQNVKRTWFGDSNVDGVFDSGDLVRVFQIGKYEDGVGQNSTWAEGDWTGDGEFDSSDFVLAFQDGGYESGRRPKPAVPEPSSVALFVAGILCDWRARQT